MMSICACLKETYCRLLNSAAVWIDEAVEKHMSESKLELKEVKISISCFLFLFFFFLSRRVLHPGRHPVRSTTPRFVSGQGWVAKSIVLRDCVRTHERHPCICASGCLRVHVHSVYSGGQGHCFHSPSPSLPHPICHECHASGWKLRKSPQENGCFHITNGGKRRGNGSGKVSAVLRRGQSKTVRMEKKN